MNDTLEIVMWATGGAAVGVTGALSFLWTAINKSKDELMSEVNELKRGTDKAHDTLWKKFSEHDENDRDRDLENERRFASKSDVTTMRTELQGDINSMKLHIDGRFNELIAIIMRTSFGRGE